MVANVLDTVSHEFFHAGTSSASVRRASSRSISRKPTSRASSGSPRALRRSYGSLIMARSGLSKRDEEVADIARAAISVINNPGRQFRSAVQMSQLAPFTDAARSIDKTNHSITFISYYTYGCAVALALDLTLRDRSNGALTLDDYMKAMWRVHGKPGGSQPGLVGKPVHPC